MSIEVLINNYNATVKSFNKKYVAMKKKHIQIDLDKIYHGKVKICYKSKNSTLVTWEYKSTKEFFTKEVEAVVQSIINKYYASEKDLLIKFIDLDPSLGRLYIIKDDLKTAIDNYGLLKSDFEKAQDVLFGTN